MSERLEEAMLDMRGVDTPCTRCGGWGVRAYGSTATWRGGIGGQAITSDVCDHCWGSGDENRHWPSWRSYQARYPEDKGTEAALRAICDMSERDGAGFRRNTLRNIHDIARKALVPNAAPEDKGK